MTLDPPRKAELVQLARGLGIDFVDLDVLHQALLHSSYINECDMPHFEGNERLEFLGDAVLDLIVTEILFEKFEQENEGFLTKLRAKLVRADTLYEFALKLNLNAHLEIGDRAAGQGIELSKSVLSDVFEAVTAAIYVTKGYETAFGFIEKCINDFIDFDDIITKIDNYKSLLMEYSQSERLDLPRYLIESEEGPGHNKTFHVAVYIGDSKLGEGTGKSKAQLRCSGKKGSFPSEGFCRTYSLWKRPAVETSLFGPGSPGSIQDNRAGKRQGYKGCS